MDDQGRTEEIPVLIIDTECIDMEVQREITFVLLSPEYLKSASNWLLSCRAPLRSACCSARASGLPGFQASIVLAGSSPFNVFDFLAPRLALRVPRAFSFCPILGPTRRGLLFMPGRLCSPWSHDAHCSKQLLQLKYDPTGAAVAPASRC